MRTRNALRTTAVSAALALTGSGLAWAGVTAPAPTPTAKDGVTANAQLASHGQDGHKHGGQAGHLPAESKDLALVGQMRINQDVEGRVADVAVHKGFAYVAAFNERDCQKGGVYVFDIRNVRAPKQINFIRTANNSYVGEGSQTLTLDTPAYKGDVLIHNNEICTGGGNAGGTDQSVGGISLVDVTNPKVHKYLAKGVGDYTAGSAKAHAVHSAFAWQDGQKAYAVIVDNDEAADIDILDITDPRTPKLIAEYDLDTGTKVIGTTTSAGPKLVADPVKGSSESFLHDMVVKKIGSQQVMLASYWDGGYVKLDVTDPTKATLLADSDFSAEDAVLEDRTGQSREDEGNAHQAEFNADDTRILAADEDFSPFSFAASYGTAKTPFAANSGDGTKQLTAGQTLEGDTYFAGRACTGDTVPAAPGGATSEIAVVERGVCAFTEKVANVQAKGWDAALIVNRVGSDGCEATLGMSVTGGIPAFGVAPRSLAYDLFTEDPTKPYDEAACLAADTPAALSNTSLLPIALAQKGEPVSFESYFDGWGYLRLFENTPGTADAPSKLKELAQFAIPAAHDPSKAVGFGDLSVHEVAFSEKDPDIAYVSYYAGGTRVYEISDNKITEIAAHVDAGGSNVWGVQVFQSGGKEYVAASDRDYGIQIFELIGEKSVND